MSDCECSNDYDSVTGENHLDECDECYYSRKYGPDWLADRAAAEAKKDAQRTDLLRCMAIFPSSGSIDQKFPILLQICICLIALPDFIAANPSVRGTLMDLILTCESEGIEDLFRFLSGYFEDLKKRTDYVA
jgi:hypothetical protein